MTNEEILEYNKRCAEFLGFKYKNSKKFWVKYPYDDNSFLSQRGYMRIDNLQFHSDWNWIMKIVESILKEYRTDFYLDFDMPINDTFTVSIGSDGKYNSIGESNISSKEAVIQAINQFLIWYYEYI